jgi:hypothetical protein
MPDTTRTRTKPRAKRKRQPRSTDDVAGALLRQLRAFGERVSQGDPDEMVYLLQLRDVLDQAFVTAVAGMRAAGYSDGAIGHELRGITGQAVNKRWPRQKH